MKKSSALLAAVLLVVGCASDDDALFVRGEKQFKEGEYDPAIATFKQYLMRHPDHSGAHLYLGRCFMLGPGWMVPAEGEIETALHLFEEDGRRSTINEFNDTYFELRCYFDLLFITQMRIAVLLDSPGAPAYLLSEHVTRFKQLAAKATEIAPGDPDVGRYNNLARLLDEGARVIPGLHAPTPPGN